MEYKISFCFPDKNNIVLHAFVSAENALAAKDKFYNDYPNFEGVNILNIGLFKGSIRFLTKKDIYWDDWGREILVFGAGEIYSGVLHCDGKITAESPYYGVSDYVESEDIEILN